MSKQTKRVGFGAWLGGKLGWLAGVLSEPPMDASRVRQAEKRGKKLIKAGSVKKL